MHWHPSCVVPPRSPRLVRGSDNMEHFHRRSPSAIFCQPPCATCHFMIIMCNMFPRQTYIVLPSSKSAHTKDIVTSHAGLFLDFSQQSLSCSSLTHTKDVQREDDKATLHESSPSKQRRNSSIWFDTLCSSSSFNPVSLPLPSVFRMLLPCHRKQLTSDNSLKLND